MKSEPSAETSAQTISSLLDALDIYGLVPEQQQILQDRTRQILTTMEEPAKSMGWKVRARVGEKAPWHELPEADEMIVG